MYNFFVLSVCRPPTVSVGLEYTQYEVSEDLRHDHYALQVCAVTTGALFPVNVAIEPVNGTAYGKYRASSDCYALIIACKLATYDDSGLICLAERVNFT